MDLDSLIRVINWATVPLMGVVGWLFKRLKEIENKSDVVRIELGNHKIHVAQTYLTRPEHLDVYSRFDVKLDRILDKLDQKQDK